MSVVQKIDIKVGTKFGISARDQGFPCQLDSGRGLLEISHPSLRFRAGRYVSHHGGKP